MKWIVMLCSFLTLTSCFNGRDALETHQIIAEPKTMKVGWEHEAPIDVTEEHCTTGKPCQRLVN